MGSTPRAQRAWTLARAVEHSCLGHTRCSQRRFPPRISEFITDAHAHVAGATAERVSRREAEVRRCGDRCGSRRVDVRGLSVCADERACATRERRRRVRAGLVHSRRQVRRRLHRRARAVVERRRLRRHRRATVVDRAPGTSDRSRSSAPTAGTRCGCSRSASRRARSSAPRARRASSESFCAHAARHRQRRARS